MGNETETIIQEATKVVIREAAEKIGNFLNKLLGETVIELGGIPHDWAKYYRYRNLLSIQDKIEAIHKKRKAEGKTLPIPPRYAIPLIQNASQENDESLQEMWAELISNFIDPQKHFNPEKIYIEILSSLEPLDAKVLHFFLETNI